MAKMFKAIADPARLQLLHLIRTAPDGEACVGSMTDRLGLQQPTISHHLKVLTQAGLLSRERRATWVWYSVIPEGLAAVEEVVRPHGEAGA